MDRREFIKKSMITSAGLALLPGLEVNAHPSVGKIEMTGHVQRETINTRRYRFREIVGELDPEIVLNFAATTPRKELYIFERARMDPELHDLGNPGEFIEEIEVVADIKYRYSCINDEGKERVMTKLINYLRMVEKPLNILGTDFYCLPAPGYSKSGFLGRREKIPEQTDFYLMNKDETEIDYCQTYGTRYWYKHPLFKGKVFRGRQYQI